MTQMIFTEQALDFLQQMNRNRLSDVVAFFGRLSRGFSKNETGLTVGAQKSFLHIRPFDGLVILWSVWLVENAADHLQAIKVRVLERRDFPKRHLGSEPRPRVPPHQIWHIAPRAAARSAKAITLGLLNAFEPCEIAKCAELNFFGKKQVAPRTFPKA